MRKLIYIAASGNRQIEFAILRGKVLANSLTLSRVLRVPVFLYQYRKGTFLACFLVMIWIDLSDILDGFVARISGCQTFFGAVLDAVADFIVLFTLFILYCISGYYPFLLIILMVLSFGLFILVNLLDKVFVKSRFGKYTGAVLYTAATLGIASQALYPHLSVTANGIAVFLSTIILAVSIIENLMHLYWRQYFCPSKGGLS